MVFCSSVLGSGVAFERAQPIVKNIVAATSAET